MSRVPILFIVSCGGANRTATGVENDVENHNLGFGDGFNFVLPSRLAELIAGAQADV